MTFALKRLLAPAANVLIVFVLCFASFKLGGIYKLHQEHQKIRLETAVQALKFYKTRGNINEKADSLSVNQFCTSMLGLSDGARKSCMRRLGTLNAKSRNNNTDISTR